MTAGARRRSGRCSPSTATRWRRTHWGCGWLKPRTCWSRCRTRSSPTRSRARSPPRPPARRVGGRAGTRTPARSWCAACSVGAAVAVPPARAGQAQRQRSRTFQPLAELLPDRTTPELAYLQARFAGLVSYGITAKLLGELLPLGRRLHPAVVRRQTQAVAQRLEDELGDERFSFIDTCQRVREELPRPDLPLVVGLDGGYVQ